MKRRFTLLMFLSSSSIHPGHSVSSASRNLRQGHSLSYEGRNSGISPAKAAIRRDLARFKLKTDLLLSPLCPQISNLFLKDLTFPASGVEEFKRGLSSADLDQISLLASPASSQNSSWNFLISHTAPVYVCDTLCRARNSSQQRRPNNSSYDALSHIRDHRRMVGRQQLLATGQFMRFS